MSLDHWRARCQKTRSVKERAAAIVVEYERFVYSLGKVDSSVPRTVNPVLSTSTVSVILHDSKACCNWAFRGMDSFGRLIDGTTFCQKEAGADGGMQGQC